MLTALVLAVVAQAPYFVGDIETIATDRRFTEGPQWHPEGHLVYTDIPASTIYREDGGVVRKPSGMTNGLTLDREGRLLCFEHEGRRVSRIEASGDVTELATGHDGKRFNSPNDGVVRSDGVVFFTDPNYGLAGRDKEIPFQGVYALTPDGDVHLLADDFSAPNGIDLSPDESWLYVADTEKSHVRRLRVSDDFQVVDDTEFCPVATPDGIRADTLGNLWVTSADGVVVFSPEGERVGERAFPQIPANCTFGGADSQWLYVTARSAVYRIRTGVKGQP